MQRVLFTMVFVLPFLLNGQTQATILYETRSNATRITNGVVQDLPVRITKNELLFASSKSVFRNIPSAEEDQHSQSEGPGAGLMFSNRLQIQYHDYDMKERLTTHELGNKEYIQRASIPDLKWIVLNEEKTILNLPCRKAKGTVVKNELVTSVRDRIVNVTRETDTLTVFAWYTLSIPLPVGPDKFTGLPGAVLQVENNKGRILYKAVLIKPDVKLKDIQPPSKGEMLSADAFEKADKEYREKSTRARNGL